MTLRRAREKRDAARRLVADGIAPNVQRQRDKATLGDLTLTGADPFQVWLDRLKDLKARVAILRRVDRLLADNFGDHKYLKEGVCSASTSAPDTECIRGSTARPWYFCFALIVSGLKHPTLPRSSDTGPNMNGDEIDSQKNACSFSWPRRGHRGESSVTSMLKAMGLRLAVQPIGKSG